MVDLFLLIRTVKHLRFRQLFYQVWYRVRKPNYRSLEAPGVLINRLKTEPVAKEVCLKGNRFVFLNLENQFDGWASLKDGMLWAYNQNYFDWINQEGISEEEGCNWIDKFIEDLPNNRVGLDPYPTALRSINWVKFFCRYPEAAIKLRLDSLYSQLGLLEKKLEYHLLGNHLLEDAFALYIGGSFFNDERMRNKAIRLLGAQLKEQVLPDGAHFEQSPMYHCIMLDRLLDCINIKRESVFEDYAQRMLGHMESIIYRDGSMPLMNDAAKGIAPLPAELFDYARRLGLEWNAIPLRESGYRKILSDSLEAVVDVGNLTASYQPGHTHADTFNFELRVDGKPYVVDTGISTYNKTERRQEERSTVAHNCVSPDRRDSSEVWGGFRVGRRCRVEITEDTYNVVEAVHDGFGKPYRRRFEMNKEGFRVEDWYDGEAVSYVHLADSADEHHIKVEGALSVVVRPWNYSEEYNKFLNGKVVEIKFKGHCQYTIQ